MTSTQATPSDKSTTPQPADCTFKGLVAFTKELQSQVSQLRNALDQEREHVRLLQRQKQDEVKRVRSEEQQKATLQMSELRARLQQEKLSELQRQKETLTKNFESEFQRLLHRGEEDTRQARAEIRRVREELTAQVRDAERRAAARSVEGAEHDVRRLAQEVADLRGAKRHLEEELNAAREKERRLASELRRTREKQETSLSRWQRDEEAVVRKLVRELKVKDRMIGQLEWKLGNRLGNTHQKSGPRAQLDSSYTSPTTPPNHQQSNKASVHEQSSSVKKHKTEAKKHAKKRKLSPNLSLEAGEATSSDHTMDTNLKTHKKGLTKVSPAMYKRLYAEHLQLQRSFALLRHLVAEEQVKNGTHKISAWPKEKLLLESAVRQYRQKVDELSEELRETHEQNELLEFRVLELEQCQGKGAFSKALRECAINTEPCDVIPYVPPPANEKLNLSNFEFLVKQFPITDPKEEHATDLKNSLRTIFYYPGIPTKQKQELARTAAHIESCHAVMNRIRTTIAELVAKAQTLEQEKKTLVSRLSPSEFNEDKLEFYQKELETTRQRLSEVEAELKKFSDRQRNVEAEVRAKDEKIQGLEKLIRSSCAPNLQHANDTNGDASQESSNSKVVLLLGDKHNDDDYNDQIILNEEKVGESARKGVDGERSSSERRFSDCTLKEVQEQCMKCQELLLKISQHEEMNQKLDDKLRDLEKSEQELTEKNLRLYIDYVSAKEQIQRLLLEIGAKRSMETNRSTELFEKTDDFPNVIMRETDSFNVIPSEDEGLGDESRRGDSTGPSSLVDMHESDEDILAKSSELDSDILEDSGYDLTPSLDSEVSLTSSQNRPLQFPPSKSSEIQHINKVQDGQCKNDGQVLRQEINALKEMLEKTVKERDAFHEQVLELEEAENDARRECQRLQGQMDMLLDRGEELQMHLLSTKKQLDYSNRKASMLESNCEELNSQVKYLETVIDQYKTHIQALENSESALQLRIEELSSNTELITSEKKCDIKNTKHGSKVLQVKDDDDSKDIEIVESSTNTVVCIEQLQKPSSAELVYIEEDTEGFDLQEGDVQIQVDMSEGSEDEGMKPEETGHMTKPAATCCGTQTEPELSDICPLCVTPTSFEPDRAGHRCVILPPWDKVPPPSLQVDLMERLSALEQDDCNLQEQLHKMDEMNLALWQKLHLLETRVGLCKKATFPRSSSNDAEGQDNSAQLENPAQFANRHKSATERLDGLLLEAPTCSSPLRDITGNAYQEDKDLTKNGSERDNTRQILERIVNLENSEHKLKERLLHLEYINQEFEKELEMREKLYREKEARNRDWTDIENELHRLIQSLEREKSSLIQKVNQLEGEKKNLQEEGERNSNQLSLLKNQHTRAIETLKREYDEDVKKLRRQIDFLEEKEQRHLVKLSQLEEAKERMPSEIKNSDKDDKQFVTDDRVNENLDEKYIAVSRELEEVKDAYQEIKHQIQTEKEMMMKLKGHFEEQLRELLDGHCMIEKKLEGEIALLLSKERDYCKQIAKLQDKEVLLDSELKAKEKELEDLRSQHAEQIKILEEEHQVMEAELRLKLKQLEDNTTVTMKTLQEEKAQVETHLQADIKDLQMKETAYQRRIQELEGKISELRKEISVLSTKNAEKPSSKFTREDVAKLLEELKEMHSREENLKQALDDMEKREAAYQETLQNADIIVSSLQRSYQEKIDELEMSEKQLKLRIAYLEGVEARLRSFLKNEKGSDETKRSRELIEELIEADTRESTLRDRICVLEMSEKGLTQKIREMEKRQKQLELELQEHDELVATIDSLQREREDMKKEMTKLHRSEQMLQEMLIQSETLLSHKEEEAREKFQSLADDNKSREETICQMRNHIKELNEQLASCQMAPDKVQKETTGETIHTVVEGKFNETEALAEQDDAEREFRIEVSRLRHSLSSTNAQLLEMDKIRHCQETELVNLKQENSSLQQRIKQLEERITSNHALQTGEIKQRAVESNSEITNESKNAGKMPSKDALPDTCQELEKSVKRAMFAMEMEIQQKGASPAVSPVPHSPTSPNENSSNNPFASFWPTNSIKPSFGESSKMCILLHDFSTTSFPQGSREARHQVQLLAGQRVTVVGATLPDGNCVIQLQDNHVLVPAKILRDTGAPSH